MAPSSKKTNKLLVVIVSPVENEMQPTKQSLALTLCVYVTTIGGSARSLPVNIVNSSTDEIR